MHAPLPTRTPAVLLALLAGCAAPRAHDLRRAQASPEGAARPLPALEEAVSVWEGRSARPLAFADLLARLSAVDAVFLGETHLDDTTHRVELAVLEGLIERRAGRVVLSLEMFERDMQPALDDYLAGRIDEASFLAAARPWKNYASDYRPLVETAKRHGIPVVAANTPAALRRKVSSGGAAALAALAPEERRLFPAEILPAEPGYWERVDRATRGHMDFASQPEEKRLYSGQNLWDNSMGAACAEALAAHPGAAVVHVVGGFHVLYGAGTAAHFRRRAPGATSAVVEILATPGLHAARPERDAERADYLVYATELARSLSSGTHAVTVPLELRYTLDLPDSAGDAARAPLVVWLPASDERPADARAFLRAALGAEAALAVVEPPFPEPADDLAPGGRWARASEFRSDQARLLHGLERLVEYVTRRLPVDGERVVVAGRGSGATVVLWGALYTEWLDESFLAVDPRGAGALRLEGLPERGPATRALDVLAEDVEGLAWIRDDYARVGVPTELGGLAAGVPVLRQAEDALRRALALPAAPAAGTGALCVLERDLPRARQWAEAFARRLGPDARVVSASELRGDEDPARLHRLSIGAEWPLAAFAQGQGLPLAEGDFGGTTVLVVHATAEASEREAWLELERTKALKSRSPFAGLRVAVDGGEPSLAQVLGDLAASGARSVLVVPARFSASAEEMRALWSSLDPRLSAGDAFDLAWLPGLGAELCGSGAAGP